MILEEKALRLTAKFYIFAEKVWYLPFIFDTEEQFFKSTKSMRLFSILMPISQWLSVLTQLLVTGSPTPTFLQSSHSILKFSTLIYWEFSVSLPAVRVRAPRTACRQNRDMSRGKHDSRSHEWSTKSPSLSSILHKCPCCLDALLFRISLLWFCLLNSTRRLPCSKVYAFGFLER